jgi:3-oxoadipate enol-lactonase
MQWATRNWVNQNSPAAWALEEWGRNDLPALMQAAIALSRFDSYSWLSQVDVPTAVVVTEQDNVVPPIRQRRLADAIPGSTVFTVASDHRACVDDYRLFVPALLAACSSVAGRAGPLAGRSQADCETHA